MIRKYTEEILDNEFDNVIMNCHEKINQYIMDNFINDFVAYDIAISYQMDFLWEEPLQAVVDSAIDDLSQATIDLCDIEKIKKILKEKYDLKIVNDDPIEIKKVNKKNN